MWCVIHQWDGKDYKKAHERPIDVEGSIEEVVETVWDWYDLLPKWFDAVDGVIDVRVDIYEEDGIAEQVYLRREVGLEQIQKMLKKAEEYWKGPEEEYLIHYDIGEWDQWYYARGPSGPKAITYSRAVKIAREWGIAEFPFPPEE